MAALDFWRVTCIARAGDAENARMCFHNSIRSSASELDALNPDRATETPRLLHSPLSRDYGTWKTVKPDLSLGIEVKVLKSSLFAPKRSPLLHSCSSLLYKDRRLSTLLYENR